MRCRGGSDYPAAPSLHLTPHGFDVILAHLFSEIGIPFGLIGVTGMARWS